MGETMVRTSLGEIAARNLADVTKTAPQMGSLSPRWLLRMLPWVDVDAGLLRLTHEECLPKSFLPLVLIPVDQFLNFPARF